MQYLGEQARPDPSTPLRAGFEGGCLHNICIYVGGIGRANEKERALSSGNRARGPGKTARTVRGTHIIARDATNGSANKRHSPPLAARSSIADVLDLGETEGKVVLSGND
jgi:hypothetical protein